MSKTNLDNKAILKHIGNNYIKKIRTMQNPSQKVRECMTLQNLN